MAVEQMGSGIEVEVFISLMIDCYTIFNQIAKLEHSGLALDI